MIAKISNLTKKFNSVTAIKSINFEVEEGKILAILGPSGCGKSTLLQLIAGLEEPDQGQISINNKIVYSKRKNIFISPDKREIALVFQNYALWPHYNVFDNVAYPLKVRKEKKSVIKDKVRSILSLVKLEDAEVRYPNELSGGEQQRVALARALIMEPKILLLDEPFSNLDAKLKEEMQYEIKGIQQKMGLTILHVTHDQNEAMSIADKIIIMREGEIVQKGDSEEIYCNPCNQFVANFIGKMNTIDSDLILEFNKRSKFSENKLNKIISDKLANNFVKDNKTLFFRPEEIKLNTEEGLVKAKIIERRYLGNLIEYKLMIKDHILLVQTNPDEKYQAGDEAYIDFISCYKLEVN